jgi:preprotein translocase subunit SecG
MAFLQFLLMFLLFFLAVFLIVLILIQRGKGGGLAGAFGGMGGQSAFGTKAGDLFTKITIGAAIAWILLCIVSVKVFSGAGERIDVGNAGGEQSAPANPGGGTAPAAPAEAPDSTPEE